MSILNGFEQGKKYIFDYNSYLKDGFNKEYAKYLDGLPVEDGNVSYEGQNYIVNRDWCLEVE